jgi:HEAT repeat protein
MSELNPILTQILAADRPLQQRLSLLQTIKDELVDDPSIQALLAAAREEKTLELRNAFLQIAFRIDITRISDRDRYIDNILHFAAFEENVALRRDAIVRLGRLAGHEARAEEILLESLCCDLDPNIQLACLDALSHCVNKAPETIKRLLEFARGSPRGLRKDLVQLFGQLQSDDAQAGLSIFLHPSEDLAVRRQALTKLGQMPKLSPDVSAQIFRMVTDDPSAQLQQQAVLVLRDSKQIDAELFARVFSLLTRFPDRTDLLEAVRYRLASFPELLKTLPEVFVSATSAQIRLRILELVKNAPAIELFIKALSDPKWQVRRAAIEICRVHYADNADRIGMALVEAARAERIVVLRQDIARAFRDASRRNASVDKALTEWFERETEPRVQSDLVLALRAIPANGEHRGAMLRAYRTILSEPFCDKSLRATILDELGNFHLETDPGYADDLKSQLRRCSSVQEMETLYARLRAVESDPSTHGDLLLQLFYRFIGEYPREVLANWLTDFKNLSAHNERIRGEIPYIVQLTGASWILGAAEADAQKSVLLPALLEQVRVGKTIEAVRLLEEAFANRTLRKSDLITFFKSLLPMQHVENVMNRVIVLMQRGGLDSREILEVCFDFLRDNPRDSSHTSMVSDFLQGVDQDHTPRRTIDEKRPDYAAARKQDPNYRALVFEAFSQEGLSNYWGDLPEEFDKPFEAKDDNDWEYQKWADCAQDWNIAKMFFDLKPYDRIIEILRLPVNPEISSPRTLQFLILKKLWPEPDLKFPDRMTLIEAVGSLFRSTRKQESQRLLNDRAVLVFYTLWDRWINRQEGLSGISPLMSEMAAEIYAAVCQRKAAFFKAEKKFPEVFPEILIGMDVEHLKSLWPFDAGLWTAISKAKLEAIPDELKARQLHTTVLTIQDEGRFEECFVLYEGLLKLKHTSYVKTHYSILAYRKDDFDWEKKPSEDDEKTAQFQYDSILEKVNKNAKPSQITHAIEYAFGKLWKTKVLTEHRAELLTLRNKMRLMSEE